LAWSNFYWKVPSWRSCFHQLLSFHSRSKTEIHTRRKL
jgi:hypothetical protein